MAVKFNLDNLTKLQEFAESFARSINKPFCCYLKGELGVGKTTLVQYILKTLGINEIITSPTFTIVERYTCGFDIFHIDLYRIDSPDELEYTEIPEMISGSSMIFIEWAENGGNLIPLADLLVELLFNDNGRQILMTARSARASEFLTNLLENVSNNKS
ncbi:MAG: tRNA (adenosine(37)-N6)-threonylcarbamoyltransferase complex ATPase subunit type 1 TsaE [Legionellales bacterium]|nr:tRNA (adenosine(37)-N6)-threonylcarbamoyltransferase complex ATPase subunit type 1 TsaE [Legionellales bacterium]